MVILSEQGREVVSPLHILVYSNFIHMDSKETFKAFGETLLSIVWRILKVLVAAVIGTILVTMLL